jgi:hypothetical protein
VNRVPSNDVLGVVLSHCSVRKVDKNKSEVVGNSRGARRFCRLRLKIG